LAPKQSILEGFAGGNFSRTLRSSQPRVAHSEGEWGFVRKLASRPADEILELSPASRHSRLRTDGERLASGY